MRKFTLHNSKLAAIALTLLVATSNSAAQAGEPVERCNVGDAMSALTAFYPGLNAVNEFTYDENGQFTWTVVRRGGVGDGLGNCNFRLYAAAVPYIPDAYEFCSNDVFLGGNALSFPYNNPDARAFLDFYYPDFNGSYRNKAILELSFYEEQVTVTRETYYDTDGDERDVGDGGSGDPALTDPTAGDAKSQDLVVTNYRDFFSGEKIVYRHEGFLGQFEAGKYWVTTNQFFDGYLVAALPPVELNIVPCD
jgi:hypothetical protein